VTFEARADDNGEGTGADTFNIDQCNGGGRVVAGNVQYHPS
jgi:hypothetical protein